MQSIRWPAFSRRSGAPFCGAVALACAVTLTAFPVRAKDPPRRTAENRKPVDVCAAYGEGFIKAPGSDTCIKVSGRVRMEGAARW